MKRFWIGLGILGVLLVSCILVSRAMENLHAPLARDLEAASQAALEEDWERAEALVRSSREAWEKNWRLVASVADHSPMDEVDSLFAQLPAFAAGREHVHYAAVCAQLSGLMVAMEEAHGFGWWNLL